MSAGMFFFNKQCSEKDIMSNVGHPCCSRHPSAWLLGEIRHIISIFSSLWEWGTAHGLSGLHSPEERPLERSDTNRFPHQCPVSALIHPIRAQSCTPTCYGTGLSHLSWCLCYEGLISKSFRRWAAPGMFHFMKVNG